MKQRVLNMVNKFGLISGVLFIFLSIAGVLLSVITFPDKTNLGFSIIGLIFGFILVLFDIIHRRLINAESILNSIETKIVPPANHLLLEKLDDIYDAASRIIEGSVASPGKPNYMKTTTYYRPDSESTSAKERQSAYFDVKDRRILKESWYCNDLVIVDPDITQSVDELKRRLLKYKSVPTYSIAIHIGPLPYVLRMLIVNGIAAHLRLPSKFQYFESETCLEFHDSRTVRALEDWFDELWSRSVLIKQRNRLTFEVIPDEFPFLNQIVDGVNQSSGTLG